MNGSILVVDDEPGIRSLLAWELSAEGYEVTEAADGAEALEQLRHREFDVLISDIRMPRVGGLEVLKLAKELAPETEVVIATGHAELEYAVECVRRGAFDFLQKPFHNADVLSTVTRALELRSLRRKTAVHEASRAILDGRELQQLPELIVELALSAMSADTVALLLPDAGGRPYVAHARSVSGGGVAAVEGIGEPREPALLVLDDGSAIVYPLLAATKLVGILYMKRRAGVARFRTSDLERAAILASQALLALENARLVRQVASSERLVTVGLLATGVAHEINNPVACVIANHAFLNEQLPRLTTGIEEGEFLDDVRAALSELGEGAARIRDITQDLKSLGRHDESKPIVFDPNEAIRSALRISGVELRRRARVVEELETGLRVLGVPGRLFQVLTNLLVNAAQSLAGASAKEPSIVVRSRRLGDRVVLSVRDNGPGIRPEHLPRIFETFFTTKGAGVGTGLGLAISREIVAAHGGELRADSTFGEGAIFTVTLPFAATG